ncbi:class I SAM-dependent methyltransferase [Chloroflexota bacterium]
MRITSSISRIAMLAIAKNRRVTRLILRMLMHMDNLCYRNISRFATIAEEGIHPKHRLTNYHQFFVDSVDSQDAILDIGCGNGFLTYDVAKKARNVTAIDLNKDNIELARRNFSKDNIKYICGDAAQFDFEEKFDVVILSNVLEHLDNRCDFLLKLKKLANKFLIRVPVLNRNWLTYYKRELGVEYRLDLTHKIEYTLESLQQELEKAGMSIERASIQFGEIWAIVTREQ